MFMTDKTKGQPPKKVRKESNTTRDDRGAIIEAAKEKLEGRKKLPRSWCCGLTCGNLG